MPRLRPECKRLVASPLLRSVTPLAALLLLLLLLLPPLLRPCRAAAATDSALHGGHGLGGGVEESPAGDGYERELTAEEEAEANGEGGRAGGLRRWLKGKKRKASKADSYDHCCKLLQYPEPKGAQHLGNALRYEVCGSDSSPVLEVKPQFAKVLWRGFGTSLSQMGEYLGSLGPQRRRFIADLLFRRWRGLGLDMVRFQIVGGASPQQKPPMDPGWHQSPVGVLRHGGYDWNADPYQRYFLREAKKAGVRHFEAVSFSPPYWMTFTGDVRGSPKGTNLNPKYRRYYARYLVDVMRILEKVEKVTFSGLEAFNEALEGWWDGSEGHEGCSFSINQMRALLPFIRSELKAQNMSAQVSGVDSWAGWTIGAFDKNKKPNLVNLVDRIDLHGYRTPDHQSMDRDRNEMWGVRRVAELSGKPVWMTEWGPLHFHSQNQLDLALLMARTITQHINLMGVQAWFYWLAVQGGNSQWGLVRTQAWSQPVSNKGQYQVYLTQQYYAMLHFSRLISQGSRPIVFKTKSGGILNDCQHNVLAMFDQRYTRIVVTVTNQQSSGKGLSFLFSDFGSLRKDGLHTVERIQTSQYHRFFTTRIFTIRMPKYIWVWADPESVTTYIISNVTIPAAYKHNFVAFFKN